MLDRAGAKAASSEKEEKDPELATSLAVAGDLQSKLADYQHLQKIKDQDLGLVGRWLGGKKSAPIAVAAIALFASIIVFIGMHVMLAVLEVDEERTKIIVSAADKCFALATLALGYVCGKSS